MTFSAKYSLIASLLSTTFIGHAALAQSNAAIIKIDGSSTVYPITEAVAEDFQKLNKGADRKSVV